MSTPNDGNRGPWWLIESSWFWFDMPTQVSFHDLESLRWKVWFVLLEDHTMLAKLSMHHWQQHLHDRCEWWYNILDVRVYIYKIVCYIHTYRHDTHTEIHRENIRIYIEIICKLYITCYLLHSLTIIYKRGVHSTISNRQLFLHAVICCGSCQWWGRRSPTWCGATHQGLQECHP